MKTMFESVWYWMASHPMLTIWAVVTVQFLLIKVFGGAE
jgi:hypothetical protein